MAALTSEQRKQLARIRKLVSYREFGDVEQGIARLDALDAPALWAVFAEGLTVLADGRIDNPQRV